MRNFLIGVVITLLIITSTNQIFNVCTANLFIEEGAVISAGIIVLEPPAFLILFEVISNPAIDLATRIRWYPIFDNFIYRKI